MGQPSMNGRATGAVDSTPKKLGGPELPLFSAEGAEVTGSQASPLHILEDLISHGRVCHEAC